MSYSYRHAGIRELIKQIRFAENYGSSQQRLLISYEQ